jgi:hypothetical protein
VALGTLLSNAEETAMLNFTNGDRLNGSLVKMSGDHVFWKSNLLQAESKFFLHQVQDISLPYFETPDQSVDHVAHIRFNADLRQQNENLPGDVIQGQLVAVNQDNIILNTWYAGQLTLNRNMVKDLEIHDLSTPLYSGPNKKDEWQSIPDSAWEWEKNSYIRRSDGMLAKTFPNIPARYCFSFLGEWRSEFTLKLQFAADDVEEDTRSGYALNLNPSTTYMHKRTRDNQGTGLIGDYTRHPELRTKEKSYFRLFVDTSTGLFALYSDDDKIQQWNDNTKSILSGKGIQLGQPNGNSSPLSISRIRLSEWDGTLPDSEVTLNTNAINNPEPEKDEQRIHLRNGDILLGKVHKIENSEISLTTRFNEIKLPVSRIKKLALAPNEYDERLLQNGDIRAWFQDGDYVTFRLEEITADGKIKGYSQHFGTATFDPRAFSRLECNIYPVHGSK